jgi:hypothetical protein
MTSVRTLAIAALLAAATPALVLAQSSPPPANQSGPGVSPSAPSPTDPAAGSASGNTRAVPERGVRTAPGTTGSGMSAPSRRMDRDNTSVPGQGVNKDDATPRR